MFSNSDLATLIPMRNLEMSVLRDWKLGMTVFIDTISKAGLVYFPEVFVSVTISIE